MKTVHLITNIGLMFLLLLSAACRKQASPPSSSEDTKRIIALEEEIKRLKLKDASPTSTDGKSLAERSSEKQSLDEATIGRTIQIDQGGFVLHIQRILVDEEIVASNAITKSQLEFDNLTGNNVLYLGVSVKNVSPGPKRLKYSDFYLSDASGSRCKPLKSSDAIDATVQSGESTNGGLTFSVPTSCRPEVLVYTENFRELNRVEVSGLSKTLGLDDPSQAKSRIRDSMVNLQSREEERNPLNFTVNDIYRNYNGVQGPREMSNHADWSIYQGVRDGVTASFWVKNGVVYCITILQSQENINRQRLEDLLNQYSHGHPWAYSGVGVLSMMRGWERSDKRAWCEAVADNQAVLTGITVKTEAYNHIMGEMIRSVNK